MAGADARSGVRPRVGGFQSLARVTLNEPHTVGGGDVGAVDGHARLEGKGRRRHFAVDAERSAV
jgi:hypothetical protein